MLSVKLTVNFFLDLFFPRQCLGCQQLGVWLCNNCQQNQLQLTAKELKLPHAKELNEVWCVADFHNPLVSRLIKACKYRGVKELGQVFGELMRSEFDDKSFCSSFGDCVAVAVPIHKQRLRERGFNQAEEILKGLGFLTVDNLIVRHVNTKHQAELDLASRLTNIENAFEFVSGVDAVPERVIIVDDVVTTGATMNEIARVLRHKGVKKVIGLAFAHSMD